MELPSQSLFLTIFPWRLPSTVPNMSSMVLSSEMLTGQLVGRFLPTIRLRVLKEGQPIIRWSLLADLERK